MNRKTSVTLLALSLFFVASVTLVAQNGNGNMNQTGMFGSRQCVACGATAASSQPLTDTEKTWLLFMREEEKLARDVYQVLAEKYNLRVFANIAQSEQRHFEATGILITRYGLTDPAEGKAAGEFTNPDLQTLYNSLTTPGPATLIEALQAGVTIETKDIEDLKVSIANAQNTDLIKIYSNLLSGSERHLDSFNSHLEVLGVVNP